VAQVVLGGAVAFVWCGEEDGQPSGLTRAGYHWPLWRSGCRVHRRGLRRYAVMTLAGNVAEGRHLRIREYYGGGAHDRGEAGRVFANAETTGGADRAFVHGLRDRLPRITQRFVVQYWSAIEAVAEAHLQAGETLPGDVVRALVQRERPATVRDPRQLALF